MLGRLVDEEYVTRLDEPRRRYVLTLRVAALASQAVKRSELARAASPVVAVLHRQTGLTAHLVSPSYDCVLCHVHAAEDWTSTPRLRELVPAHCTAGGKTLLAGRDRWRESLLSSPLRARCRGPGASSRRTGGSPPSCGWRRAPPSPSRTASAWRSSCGARRCACARPWCPRARRPCRWRSGSIRTSCCPGVPRASWRIELPVRCYLVTDERLIPAGPPERVEPYAGELGERTYDDGFDHLDTPAVFALDGGGRRIEVAFESGFPVAQVYAPGGSDVVCFEPMTAPANALVTGAYPVAPYAATFSVRVG